MRSSFSPFAYAARLVISSLWRASMKKWRRHHVDFKKIKATRGNIYFRQRKPSATNRCLFIKWRCIPRCEKNFDQGGLFTVCPVFTLLQGHICYRLSEECSTIHGPPVKSHTSSSPSRLTITPRVKCPQRPIFREGRTKRAISKNGCSLQTSPSWAENLGFVTKMKRLGRNPVLKCALWPLWAMHFFKKWQAAHEPVFLTVRTWRLLSLEFNHHRYQSSGCCPRLPSSAPCKPHHAD